MHVAALIVAGGMGRRLDSRVPKQFIRLGGRSIVDRSLEPFLSSERVHEVVLVMPADLVSQPPESLTSSTKLTRVVAGGLRRQDSVARGFDAASPAAEVIVIHDAARPFVTRELIARTIDAAVEAGAALAAVAASDTVKEVTTVRDVPWVGRTLNRAEIYLAQTPQAFKRDVLQAAIAEGRDGAEATDEAALAERAGHPVRLVQGDSRNIKITTEADLVLAHALTADRAGGTVRVGFGYDLHRFTEGRPLVLGGITIPHEQGLAGHSDADAVCHAVTDAILGAAAAGDIGQHFSDADDRWKDASSVDLLRRAVEIVKLQGAVVENVDVVIITERPRIAPYAQQMRQVLADVLRLEMATVSIKGKTNEGVGELGRGEALAVHAVASIRIV